MPSTGWRSYATCGGGFRRRGRAWGRPETRMDSIDINCDCGESFGNWQLGADAQLLPLITPANVDCEFHGGVPLVMQRTVATAREFGIAVGAHAGRRDLESVGRRTMRSTL